MSTLVGDANPLSMILESDNREAPPWWRDRAATYELDLDKNGPRSRLTGLDSNGVGEWVLDSSWFEPMEVFGGTHTDFIIQSDRLVLDACDAVYANPPWLDVANFTTGPSIVDDYRLEGTQCLRGRNNANVRGCAMVQLPGASRVWQYDASPAGYVDITAAFNNATVTDTNPWPASEAAGDQMQVGWQVPFGGIVFTIGTLGSGGTVTWKYWNGTAWTALTGVTDGTSGFTAAGTVTWTMPSDWKPVSVNNSGKLYWVAAEVATVYGTNPVITQGLLLFASGASGHCTYLWANVAAPPSADTWANGGLRMTVSSDLTPTLTGTWPNSGPTNSRQWFLNGSDGLRMSGYVPYVFDPSVAGSLDLGSPSLAQIRRVGLMFGSIAAMATGNFNLFWDIVSIASGLLLRNGSAAGPISFSDLLAVDHTINTMYGTITQVAGIYYLTGKLYVGQDDQDNETCLGDQNQVVVFRNFPVSTGFYEVRVVGKLGALSTFQLGSYTNGLASGGCTVRGAARVNRADPSPVNSLWSLTSSDAYAVTKLYASTLSDLYRASLSSTSELRTCTIQGFGDITANGALFDDCTFQNLKNGSPISATYAVKVQTVAATLTNCRFVSCATALLWNVNADTDTKLDGTTFTSSGTGHGTELGASCPIAITLTNINFSGYSGTPGSNPTPNSGSTDAAIYNNSGKAITINIVGGNTPSVRNGAGATTVVSQSVPVTITVKDKDQVPIVGARVLVYDNSIPPGDLGGIVREETDGSGVATESYTGSTPIDVRIKARKKGFGETDQIQTLGSGGLNLVVILSPDTIVE